MATSSEFFRLASNPARPLADWAFDAVREAVLIVDARSKDLAIVMANAAARSCFLGNGLRNSLVDSSLYSLLGDAAHSAVEAALGGQSGGRPSATRALRWRCLRGEVVFSTEAKVLASDLGQRLVMLTLSGGSAEPSLASSIDHLALDLLILDRQFTVTYANASAARTAGALPGGILNYSGLSLVPVAGIPREALARALDGNHYHDDALAVRMPGGATRWFDVDVQPLKDATGIAGLAVLSIEVTERRLRKRVTKDSERRLVALTEHARDIITVAGRDGRLQYISGGIRNSLGYTAEERRSSSIFQNVHPDDVDVIQSKYAELVSGAIGSFSHQFRVRHKNGTYRWLETSYFSALDNPLINGVVVNARDITDRRDAENQLAQREEVFRLATDAVNGIIFEWDLARGTVHRSRGVQEVLGLEPDEVAQERAWSARIHPQDDVAYSKAIAAALRVGRGWTTTYRIRDSRGRYRSMLERGLVQRGEDGSPIRAIGCCVDVSEIKRLTDLLAEAQRAAKMGGWEYSYASGELAWTDEMFRIYETSAKEYSVSWDAMLASCLPESQQRFRDACAKAESSGGDFELELEVTTLRHRRLWVRLIGHLEQLDGRPFRAYGSVQNIQAQKLAQLALKKSTDWLKLSMNMAHIQAWRWDRASDSLEFAIIDGQMVHLPRVFPGIKKFLARVHPQDRLAVRRAIDHAFETGVEVQQEFRLRSPDGKGYRSYASIARPTFGADLRPSGLVGVTQDVTARYESEARLRRSEEVLRTTTANVADTLLLLDTNLRIRFANRAICEMSIEQMIGREMSVLLPEANRATVLARLRQVLTTAETETFELEVEEPAGQTQYLEIRAVLVREEGVGAGISLTVRNITERKHLEQEILDVSSRERQTIGRDLHDGLGQELTGVALMLRGLATRIHKQCPEAVAQANEIVALVNQSIETARSLARGLLLVNTDGGGLAFALRSLAERSRDLYGIEVQFHAEASPELRLSETSASHLYRIAQEALTNTARHGRASAATVLLRVTQQRFLLEIGDDGIGIAESGKGASGMGLKIMRYRAGMIGASFEIAANQPRGTVIRVAGEQPASLSKLQSNGV